MPGSRRPGLRSGTPVTDWVLVRPVGDGPASRLTRGSRVRVSTVTMMPAAAGAGSRFQMRRQRAGPRRADCRSVHDETTAAPIETIGRRRKSSPPVRQSTSPKSQTRGKWRDGGGAAAPAGNKRRALLQFRSQCKGQRAGAPRAALRRRRSSHGARAGETSLSSRARPCAAPFGPRDVCGQDRLVVRLFGGGDNKVRSAADARRRERASPRRTAATTG